MVKSEYEWYNFKVETISLLPERVYQTKRVVLNHVFENIVWVNLDIPSIKTNKQIILFNLVIYWLFHKQLFKLDDKILILSNQKNSQFKWLVEF